jgi:hypothetical protein
MQNKVKRMSGGQATVSAADKIVSEGCAFLYNFDFFKFRERAEESFRPVNRFQCLGICWKFSFRGEIRLFVNGRVVINMCVDSTAGAYTLALPFVMKIEDEVCVEVIDTQPRWFRSFRPNTAHVTLEGIERHERL